MNYKGYNIRSVLQVQVYHIAYIGGTVDQSQTVLAYNNCCVPFPESTQQQLLLFTLQIKPTMVACCSEEISCV